VRDDLRGERDLHGAGLRLHGALCELRQLAGVRDRPAVVGDELRQLRQQLRRALALQLGRLRLRDGLFGLQRQPVGRLRAARDAGVRDRGDELRGVRDVPEPHLQLLLPVGRLHRLHLLVDVDLRPRLRGRVPRQLVQLQLELRHELHVLLAEQLVVRAELRLELLDLRPGLPERLPPVVVQLQLELRLQLYLLLPQRLELRGEHRDVVLDLRPGLPVGLPFDGLLVQLELRLQLHLLLAQLHVVRAGRLVVVQGRR
jgi:hypothetical protein